MKEIPLERNSINIKVVVKYPNVPVIFKNTKAFTQERNPMNVNIVVKPSLLTQPCEDT